MWIYIDVIIKLIPLIAAIFAILRFIITTTNKSVVEILLTPNNKKNWEDFYELIIISLIVTAGISVPGFIEFPFSYQVLDILFIIDISMLFVTGITMIILWIISWFGDVSNRKKIIKSSVLGNFLLVLLLMALIFSAIEKEIDKLIADHKTSELLIIYIVCVLFVFSLFQIYKIVFKTLNKPKQNLYQIEAIESSMIIEELKSLKFEFMLDNERHVLRKSTSRHPLEFPIFIYYPKENKLIKYIKINDLNKRK